MFSFSGKIVIVIDLTGETDKKVKKFNENVAQNEYMSGGVWLTNDTLLTLAYNQDEITKRFGAERIEKMLLDPEIKKCIRVIKNSVLGDGIVFNNPIKRPRKLKSGNNKNYKNDVKRYETAKEYAEFLNRSAEHRLETPLIDTIENMLDALVYGNKVAEKVFTEYYDKKLKKNVLIITTIRVKPRESVRFVIDKFSKVVGIKGVGYEGKTRKIMVLPREKFLVFTWEGKDEDPRGTSILEACHNSWYLKTLIYPEWVKWLQQCALPGLIGTLPEKIEKTALIDIQTGQTAIDEQGNTIYKDEAVSMLAELVKMRNSSAMVVPFGAEVKPINNSTSGDPFKGMLDSLNAEMEMALLLQTLATSDSQHNTRAASTVHISVLENFIAFIKERICSMIKKDYVKQMMEFNFPDYDEDLTPVPSLIDVSRREYGAELTALAALMKSGFFSNSQLPDLDSRYGFAERDEEEIINPNEQQNANNGKTSSGSSNNGNSNNGV